MGLSVNPFLDIMVTPSYGENKAIIRWTLRDEFSQSDCFVFKSASGVKPWVSLNNEPIRNHTAFEDDSFLETSALVNTYYRLALHKDGQIYDSPIISTFEKLSRLQYQHVRKIMLAELRALQGGIRAGKKASDALRMWHFVPAEFGTLSAEIDPDTAQRIAVVPSPEGGHGQIYKGGYGKPFWTYVRQTGLVNTRVDRPDGFGVDEDSKVNARLMGFPVPQRGHMLVHPATDNRWVVEEKVKPYLAFGIVPIAFDVTLSLISRGDERYDIKVPVAPA